MRRRTYKVRINSYVDMLLLLQVLLLRGNHILVLVVHHVRHVLLLGERLWRELLLRLLRSLLDVLSWLRRVLLQLLSVQLGDRPCRLIDRRGSGRQSRCVDRLVQGRLIRRFSLFAIEVIQELRPILRLIRIGIVLWNGEIQSNRTLAALLAKLTSHRRVF